MRGHNLPIMKVTAFLDVMSRCLVGTYRRFGVTSCLYMKREAIYTRLDGVAIRRLLSLYNYRENFKRYFPLGVHDKNILK